MSAIVGFLKALAGICETKPLDQDMWQLEGNQITLYVDDFMQFKSPTGAVLIKGKGLKPPVLIVRGDDGQFYSFANACTHMGRKLDPVAGKRVLRCCSVNHSTFDYEGNKLSGPAKKPLKLYKTDLKDDEIVVTLT